MMCCALLSGLVLIVGPRLAIALRRARGRGGDPALRHHRPSESTAYAELLDAVDPLASDSACAAVSPQEAL